MKQIALPWFKKCCQISDVKKNQKINFHEVIENSWLKLHIALVYIIRYNKLSVLFCVFFSGGFHPVFGQKEIVVIDSLTKLPIENAYVYSSSKKLLAVTNMNGKFSSKENESIQITCFGFYSKQWRKIDSDTLFLLPIEREMDEITIKPKNIPELYRSIIDSSHALVLMNNKPRIEGQFYETILIIDEGKGDSIIQNKQCEAQIRITKKKKSFDYIFQTTQGENSYWTNAENKVLDTSRTQTWIKIIPDLAELLEYDLSDKNNFKIQFENTKWNSNFNQLKILDSSQIMRKLYLVDFDNTTLKSWQIQKFMNDSKERFNVSVGFEEFRRRIDFEQNEEGYFVKNCSLYCVIHMTIENEHYTIKLNKGFVSNNNSALTNLNETLSIETYCNSIKLVQKKQPESFFIFLK